MLIVLVVVAVVVVAVVVVAAVVVAAVVVAAVDGITATADDDVVAPTWVRAVPLELHAAAVHNTESANPRHKRGPIPQCPLVSPRSKSYESSRHTATRNHAKYAIRHEPDLRSA